MSGQLVRVRARFRADLPRTILVVDGPDHNHFIVRNPVYDGKTRYVDPETNEYVVEWREKVSEHA